MCRNDIIMLLYLEMCLVSPAKLKPNYIDLEKF